MSDILGAFYSQPDESSGREKKDLYIADVDGRKVIEDVGWSCAPRNPDCWWCPKYGYTLTLGVQCFETRDAAARKLISWLQKRIEGDQKAIAALSPVAPEDGEGQ